MINQLAEKYTIEELAQASVTTPIGFYAGGLHCGIKRKRHDLGWLYSKMPANAAAVYTTNVFQAAPLLVTKESIAKNGKLQGLIVNSGNANACTGDEGYENACLMRKAFAEKLQLAEDDVAVASTGIIGEQLPMDKIYTGIDQITNIEAQNNAADFEKAILTTDTVQKRAGVKLQIQGKTVTIAGCAKGSGMIEPNMATMLGFITTDANIESETLLWALRAVTNETFNMITVDGDTSTNDMVLVLANGMAENDLLTKDHPDMPQFLLGLQRVCEQLAKSIAKDGEGATKLIEVEVTGAKIKRCWYNCQIHYWFKFSESSCFRQRPELGKNCRSSRL